MQAYRSLRLLAVLLVVTLALAACGSGPAAPAPGAAEESTTGPAAGEAAAESTPAPEPAMAEAGSTAIASAGSGSTKLQVTVWLGQQELDAMVELANRFTETNPDIQVEFINIVEGGPYGRDKLQQMIAGGTPPDIMMLNTGQFEGFAARGVLAPLDDLVKQDNFDMGIYWPAAVEGSTYDGKLYALPKDMSNVVIYLNVDLFEEAGVPLPGPEWSWDDYREIARQLTKDTNGDDKMDQWGTSLVNAVWAWASFVWGNGGDILSEDRKQCLLESPETVEALNVYFGLLTEDNASVPPGTLPQQPWQGDQFMSGVIGMSTFGPWFRPGLVENEPFNWTVRPYPRSPKGTDPVTVVYTDHWGLAASSDHPNEAWELMKFLGGNEGHTAWSEIYGSRSITPVRELALSDKWMGYGGPEHRADNQAILDQLDNTRPPPVNFANANAAETAWNEEFDLVINGQQTVEEAVKNACERITPILQQP
jgi:multiple sugar transport system substrate-binding protein